MGCFNSVCVLSGIPIFRRDPVVAVLGFPKNEGRYSRSEVRPTFLPIKGKYDDYGGIEHIHEDFNTKFICDYLNTAKKNNLIDSKDDWMSSHRGKNDSIDNWLVNISHRSFSIKEKPLFQGDTDREKGRFFTLSLCLQSAWDALPKSIENIKGWRGTKIGDVKTWFSGHADEWFEWYKDKIVTCDKKTDLFDWGSQLRYAKEGKNPDWTKLKNNEFFQEMKNWDGILDQLICMDYFESLFLDKTERFKIVIPSMEDWTCFRDLTAETYSVKNAMGWHAIGWKETPYAGQDEELMHHIEFNKFRQKYLEDYRKNRRAELGYGDDE